MNGVDYSTGQLLTSSWKPSWAVSEINISPTHKNIDKRTYTLPSEPRYGPIETRIRLLEKIYEKEQIETKEKLTQLKSEINAKFEERLSKIEENIIIKKGRLKDLDNINRLEKEQKQNNILLIDRIYGLEKQIRITEKGKINTEERLNKLEEDNRELRKIIDELRQPKSKYM